jgi:hypothetical protein
MEHAQDIASALEDLERERVQRTPIVETVEVAE